MMLNNVWKPIEKRAQTRFSRSGLRGRVGLVAIVLGVALTFAFALPASGVAAAPASHFGYDLSAWDGSEIITWEAATNARDWMSAAGYTAQAFLNNSGYAAYNQFKNTSIWYSCFHGDSVGGKVYYKKWDSQAGAFCTQTIQAEPGVANFGNASTNGGRFYLNNLRRVDITRTLLAVFQHCYSSRYRLFHYPDPKYSLPAVLVAEKGIDTAVGFHEQISAAAWYGWNNPTTLWANYFFQYLAAGDTVDVASDVTLGQYWLVWGDFGGYDSIEIFGNPNLTVTPARWGSS